MKLPKVKKPLFKPYEVNLGEEEKLDFENWLGNHLDEAINAMNERNAKIESWRNLYGGDEYDREPAYEGGSNLRIPIVRILADQIMLRLVQSHFGVEPYVRIKPSTAVSIDPARSIEKMLWHVHKAGGKLMAGYLTIKDAIITGTGICKTVWEQDWKLVRDGKKRSYVLRYNNPKTEHIPTEDFVIYPAKAVQIDEAQFCGHRFWRRWDDLQRGVATGLYNEDWVETLRGRAGGDDNAKADSQDERLGNATTGQDWRDFEYELFELCVRYDLDDDGLEEDFLVTIERNTKTVIRLIEYPAGYGERWYHAYRPIPVSNSFHGESIVDQVDGIDEEITTMHNQRIDNTTLVNIPMFTVVKNSPAAADTEKAYPGKKWIVNDHDDMKPLVQIPPLRDGFMADEERLLYYAKILTGVSELNMGGGGRGEKTAYEVEASLAEGSIRVRLYVTLGVDWLTRMAWQEIGLLKDFQPEGEFERITGAPNPFEDVTWEDLWSHFDVEPTGNTTTSNKELERQKAVYVREALKSDPLLFDTVTDPTTGQPKMVPKAGWYELTKRFLIAHGYDDIEAIIGARPEEQPREPMEEIQPSNPMQGMANIPDVAGNMQGMAGNAGAV